MAIVKGAVRWAQVYQPNTKFTPVWEVDVILSKEDAVRLKKEGLAVKKDDEGNYVVKFKRKVQKASGEQNTPPRVIDKNNQVITDLIGNGSICAVQYYAKEWKYAGKSGVKGHLQGIKVLKLVPYMKDELADIKDDDFDDGETNFNANELDEDMPFDDE